MTSKDGMIRKMEINMTDVAVRPPVSVDDTGVLKMPDYRAGKLVPAYLVILEGKKTDEYFVATKFDTTVSVCAKFVGFYYEGSKDDIVYKYDEMIASQPAANFVEMLFPWTRIKSVRSLVYRHKFTGEKK